MMWISQCPALLSTEILVKTCTLCYYLEASDSSCLISLVDFVDNKLVLNGTCIQCHVLVDALWAHEATCININCVQTHIQCMYGLYAWVLVEFHIERNCHFFSVRSKVEILLAYWFLSNNTCTWIKLVRHFYNFAGQVDRTIHFHWGKVLVTSMHSLNKS